MLKKKYLVVFLAFCISCSKSFQSEELTIDVTRIQIPISENELNSYQTYSSYFDNGEKLVAYNSGRHSLNFFDLEKKAVIKNTQLERQGPSALGSLDGLLWVAEDSLLAFERGLLHLLDETGVVKNTFDLYQIYQNVNLGEPLLNFYFKLYFDRNDNTVYFFQIPMNLGQHEKVQIPLVTSLSLRTSKVKALPIYHSNYFGDIRGDVGFLSYTGFSGFLGERMIFNHQYESELYSFRDGEILVSKIHENKRVQSLSSTSTDIDSHAIRETHFLSPVPDNFRNLIYRIQWNAPSADAQGEGFLDKTMKLSVFNTELNLIYESSLSSYTYQINNWFVNENGFYMNVAHPMNEKTSEDFLVFDIFKFNVD